MLLKILLGCAVLSTVIGVNSTDGSLFFFFAVHLTVLAIGGSLRRREARVYAGSAASVSAGKPGKSAPAKKTA
jgi:hypothetical protein